MRIPLLWKLIGLLITVPLLDLATILIMSRYVGLWPTLGSVVACGILGAVLVRREGVRAWNAFQSEMALGRIPETPLLEGVLVLLSGALLMTPGPLTDLAGLVLLLPPVRAAVRLAVRRRVERMLLQGAVHVARRATILR